MRLKMILMLWISSEDDDADFDQILIEASRDSTHPNHRHPSASTGHGISTACPRSFAAKLV